MPHIELKYGRGSIPFEYDENSFEVIAGSDERAPMSDAEVGDALDSPIDSQVIEEIVEPGSSVLLVVPDATREAGAGQVANLIVRRLIANGTEPHNIKAIFATGIHRKVSEAEKQSILTPFLAQRVNTIDHEPRDLMRIVRTGETSSGIPVELDRALLEHDRIIVIGGVSYHYFAGFTGGRKSICPGLASARTVAATHKLAFDMNSRSRAVGVGPGLLDGNPVHEAFIEATATRPPHFAVNTIVDDSGAITDIYCGDWQASHRAACGAYDASHRVAIGEKRPLVIVSCGGYPHDINVIQAHKALDAAAGACTPGGQIVLVAECADGMGRDDMAAWFDAGDSSELADRLCEKYQVNGQTAWSLLKKAEEFDVRIVSSLPDALVKKMRLTAMDAASLTDLGSKVHGYILTAGAKVRITV